MKVCLRYISVLLIIFLNSTPTVISQEYNSVIQISYVHTPPLVIIEDPSKGVDGVKGHFKDLMFFITDVCQYKTAYNQLSINRFYLAIKNGDLAQVQFTPKGNPELDKVLKYSEEPVTTIRLNLYWKKVTGELDKTYTLSDLQGETLVTIYGYKYGGLIQKLKSDPKIEIIEVDSIRAAKTLLMKGRAKFSLNYQRTFFEDKSYEDAFKFLNISSLDYFISVHRSLKNADQILDCLSSAHRQQIANAKYKNK